MLIRSLALSLALLAFLPACYAQEIIFQDAFSKGSLTGWQGSGTLESHQDQNQDLHLKQLPSAHDQAATSTIPLPVEKMRGYRVTLTADVCVQAISPKPQPWNGIKAMLIVNTPLKIDYPQADIPVGDLAWQHFTTSAIIPPDATAVTLVVGLEKVSGDAWFRNITVSLDKRITLAAIPDPNSPLHIGHTEPRLRGAMVANTLRESDLADLADKWHANLIRWQLVQAGRNPPTLETYDAWLDGQLLKLDDVLTWCQKRQVKVVVDLHSPPGGELLPGGGYVGAVGAIFSLPAAQTKFLDVWKKIATRYQGRDVIWGYDLMNEPVENTPAKNCDDWQTLSLKAARLIHAIDPKRTIIVEPAEWGCPNGFANFFPLDEPRIVYSFHMYEPHNITHQGLPGNAVGPLYPGPVNGSTWNKAALEAAMKPAFDFAQRYHVHLYVGEFSCIRNAPGDTTVNYLRDAIDIFESHDADWSYHAFREWSGWSVEHTGPLDKPTLAKQPPASQLLLMQWFAKNLSK